MNHGEPMDAAGWTVPQAAPASTPPLPTHSVAPVGIGGWLLLPAIGLVINPVLDLKALVDASRWYPGLAGSGEGEAYPMMLFMAAGLLVFQVYVAWMFFHRKRVTPTIYSMLVMCSLGMLLLLPLWTAPEPEDMGNIIQTAVHAAIWIPYFRMSARVKATFVN